MSTLVHAASGDLLVIQFTQATILDQVAIDQIAKELKTLVDKTDQRKVLLDFRHVRFMSSAMLGALIRFRKQCAEYKVNLRLCGISSQIMEVFKVTNLHKVFDIDADEAAARKAFAV